MEYWEKTTKSRALANGVKGDKNYAQGNQNNINGYSNGIFGSLN